MLFKQLFDPLSSTYTYLLGCESTKKAVLIDPVVTMQDRDIALLDSLGLTLAYTIDTHLHADHITSALALKKRIGSKIAHPIVDHLPCTDRCLVDNQPLEVGSIVVKPIHTPGHTAGHFAYVVDNKVFTGDALLIDGCGRTDFQGGDARQLYASIHDKLFLLPDETLVYPGHDYQGRFVSSIAQEKKRNPRVGQAKSLAEFVSIMASLHFPEPTLMDYAIPANQHCGKCPSKLPAHLDAYCGQITTTIPTE